MFLVLAGRVHLELDVSSCHLDVEAVRLLVQEDALDVGGSAQVGRAAARTSNHTPR